jgi:5-methylcytosine-specific restriction endonuclease McrA
MTRCICGSPGVAGTPWYQRHMPESRWARYILKYPDRAAFYKSGGWKAARRVHLARNPNCAVCGAPATAVDHIVPRAEGGAGLDPSNLQSLCERHHQAKTTSEEHRGRRRAAERRGRREKEDR